MKHFTYAISMRKSLFLYTVAASMGITPQALAQDSKHESRRTAQLEEIIVTARRMEERLQDVPISIAVLDQQQIDDRNIVMGSDLALYMPSLTVNQRFGPETSSFAIRGFLQEANTAPSVGVYFAEVTTPRSLGLTASGSNLPIGAMMDLQNIQILKGPQGTLFGRNTTGGSILVEPVRPTDELEGYIEGSAGDFDMRRLQGVVNIPASDTVQMRFGLDTMQRDGYMKNRASTGVSDFNDTDYIYARFGVSVQLTPDLENYTVAHYSDSDTNGYAAHIMLCERNVLARTTLGAGIFTGPGACAQVDRQIARGDGDYDVEIPNENPFFRIEQWQVINHTNWDLTDNLTVRNIASYATYVADLQYRLGGDNFTTMPTGLGLPVPVVNGLPFTSTDIALAPTGNHSADQWTFTEELQVQSIAMDDRLTWQAGVYYEVSDSPDWNEGHTNIFTSCPNSGIQNLTCFDPFGFGNISNARQKARYENAAIYAQGTYEINEQWAVIGGIRYTDDLVEVENEAVEIRFPLTTPGTIVKVCNDTLAFQNPDGSPLVVTDPSQCHRKHQAESDEPTWVLGVDYKPMEDLLLYGKYSRGYRAGGIAVLNLGLEVWDPEQLDTYELGFKTTFDGAISGYLNAAVFYNDFIDQQLVTTIRDPNTGVAQGNAIVNAGSSEIFGFEIDTSLNLTDRLNLSVGYTYLDTEIKELDPPFSAIYQIDLLADKGDPLPQVPENRLTTSVTYTLPLDASIGEVSVGATYVYTDEQPFNKNSHPEFQSLPATDLVNFNLNWVALMGHPVDLSFFVTNVTDELIPVTYGGEYKSLAFEAAQYAAPRMWGLRLRYRFGQ